MNALGNQSKTYQMPWRKCMNFINDIQTSASMFFVELVTKKAGDLTNANSRH
jgi:hypothetical protein